MAQSVEHVLGKDEVGGSSPLSSSKGNLIGGSLFYCFADYVRYFALRARAAQGVLYKGGPAP